MAITSSYLIIDNNPHKIHALEPDLLGEWFVLFCFYKRLKFEELLNLAWKYSPKEALKKVASDDQARRNQVKKRNLHRVNEHFEPDFNIA